MAVQRNYQKEMEQMISAYAKEGRTPRLFLHACCAPCSSYVLEYLSAHCFITVFYYNPNITDREEYALRVSELRRLIREMPLANPVTLLEGSYEPERFLEAAAGLEQCPEGGERCRKCFSLRLQETARAASSSGGTYDFMTTTLTISPLKNAALLNAIGEEAAASYGLRWLPSDFKKKGGYQRSIELSRIYGLYRQNYCGCKFSRFGLF